MARQGGPNPNPNPNPSPTSNPKPTSRLASASSPLSTSLVSLPYAESQAVLTLTPTLTLTLTLTLCRVTGATPLSSVPEIGKGEIGVLGSLGGIRQESWGEAGGPAMVISAPPQTTSISAHRCASLSDGVVTLLIRGIGAH